MRLLVLTRYEDLGASSRYRMLQYLPFLHTDGFEVEVRPLLNNQYLRDLYSGRRTPVKQVVKSYLKRLSTIRLASRYDVVWIEKEAVPFLPGRLEKWLLGRGTGYVLDYDDAVFHNYDQHRNPLVRQMLGRKYDTLMRGARVVVAANPYVAQRAKESGARIVEELPTVVDLAKYDPVSSYSAVPAVFGWIGTPWTSRYLKLIRPHFESGKGKERRFTAIGSGHLEWESDMVNVKAWSEAEEVEDLRQLSVGVMPLIDSAFERGKSGLKLIQYMAVGLPVIASPVGVNTEIVEHGVNGFLCNSPEEWEDAIAKLEHDPVLRERMGKAGRRKVEQLYSLEQAAPRFARVLRQAGGEIDILPDSTALSR